jgi:hypothetical protein
MTSKNIPMKLRVYCPWVTLTLRSETHKNLVPD